MDVFIVGKVGSMEHVQVFNLQLKMIGRKRRRTLRGFRGLLGRKG